MTVIYVFGPVPRVSPKGPRPLLARRVVRSALCSVCKRSRPGTACRSARVELREMSLATPLFTLAVPRLRVQSSEGRFAWFRRPPSELSGVLHSAALSSRPSARLHLRLVSTPASSGLRAVARCTGTRSVRYLRRGRSGDGGRAHRRRPCAHDSGRVFANFFLGSGHEVDIGRPADKTQIEIRGGTSRVICRF